MMLIGDTGFLQVSKQWRNYITTMARDSYITETLPIAVSKNFVAILSDTDVAEGYQNDMSGGSAIVSITNNAVNWRYNWNFTRENLMINIFVIGIV